MLLLVADSVLLLVADSVLLLVAGSAQASVLLLVADCRIQSVFPLRTGKTMNLKKNAMNLINDPMKVASWEFSVSHE